MDVELKQFLEAMEDRLGSRIDAVESGLSTKIDAVDAKVDAVASGLSAKIDAVDAKVDAVASGLESRLLAEIRASEVRGREYIEAVEASLRDHIESVAAAAKQHTEDVETRLLTEFWKWAKTADARYRQDHAAVLAIDMRLELIEDRLSDLERGKAA